MKVTLFIPCLVEQFHPDTGIAVRRVLEKTGQTVRYIVEQTCCGQPAFNSGYREEASALAERFIRCFADSEVIVAPSGSCVSMVRDYYSCLPLSESIKKEHDTLKSRIYEFSEFLVDVLNITDVGAEFHHKVTYHESCHLLRELGISSQPRALLRNVRGLELIEMENAAECCGFGGVFSVKHPDISTEMVKAKTEGVVKTGAEFVTACDTGCLMNIQGYADREKIPVKTIHLAEILAGEVK